MNKQEFLTHLRKGLSGLPQEDIEERLTFYSEMIDDQIEEGLPEEEAVSNTGPVDKIVTQIITDTPLTKIARERIKPRRRMSVWEIILLIVGSPIWLSLVISLFAIIISLYVTLWAVIVSLWAVFASLAAGLIGGILVCIYFVAGGTLSSGLAMLAAGIVCAGLSIFMFFGCRYSTMGTLKLTKRLALWFKNIFRRKETA